MLSIYAELLPIIPAVAFCSREQRTLGAQPAAMVEYSTGRRPKRSYAMPPLAREMTRRWISLVPSKRQ